MRHRYWPRRWAALLLASCIGEGGAGGDDAPEPSLETEDTDGAPHHGPLGTVSYVPVEDTDCPESADRPTDGLAIRAICSRSASLSAPMATGFKVAGGSVSGIGTGCGIGSTYCARCANCVLAVGNGVGVDCGGPLSVTGGNR